MCVTNQKILSVDVKLAGKETIIQVWKKSITDTSQDSFFERGKKMKHIVWKCNNYIP